MADDVSDPTTDAPTTDAPEAEAPEAEATEVVAEPAGDAVESGPEPVAATETKAAGEPAVVRKNVTSKRVTPKGGATKGGASNSGNPAKRSTEGFASKRYTPPTDHKYEMPSPWWVPTIMWALLAIGVLVIMLNYMGVFGDPANIRLVIGLACILGGIITATQYR